MKNFFAEFKTFALRGNVTDMAVGVIVGAAFKSIVDSLVNDILSPAIGLLFKADFSSLALNIPNTDASIGYGSFITVVINFIIMAFAVFCLVKFLNALSIIKRQECEPEKPKTASCPYCLSEIPSRAVKCSFCASDIEPQVSDEIVQ